MVRWTPFLALLALLAGLPTAARAGQINMSPDPLGDWVANGSGGVLDRFARVHGVASATSPTPSVTLRLAATGGGEFGNATINFLYDFDAAVTGASIVASSGNVTSGPTLIATGTGGEDRLLGFSCIPMTVPCIVDVKFEFAVPPSTLSVRDQINQFTDSPGAPNQTLVASFNVASVPSIGPLGLIALAGAFAGLAGWRLRRRPAASVSPR
jgi:hypothetical protein